MHKHLCWDGLRPHKHLDLLSVCEHLNAYLVHVEDEAWVDALELCCEAIVETLDISSFDSLTCSITGDCVGVNKVFSLDVHPQGVCCDGDAQLVVDKFHHQAIVTVWLLLFLAPMKF